MVRYPPGVTTRPLDDMGLFREFLHDFYAVRRGLRGGSHDVWQPPTDVYETEADIVIKVCLPGVRTADIAVEFNGQVAKICGVRRASDPAGVRRYHQMEIRNGYFERKIAVQIPFDAEGARAEYSDGFLYVRMPKCPEPMTRLVPIRLRF
jgi:HSP20 family protein